MFSWYVKYETEGFRAASYIFDTWHADISSIGDNRYLPRSKLRPRDHSILRIFRNLIPCQQTSYVLAYEAFTTAARVMDIHDRQY